MSSGVHPPPALQSRTTASRPGASDAVARRRNEVLARGPTECDIYNSLAENTSVRVRSAPAGPSLYYFFTTHYYLFYPPRQGISPNFSIQSFSSHAISWKIHFSGAKISENIWGQRGPSAGRALILPRPAEGRRDSSHSARN